MEFRRIKSGPLGRVYVEFLMTSWYFANRHVAETARGVARWFAFCGSSLTLPFFTSSLTLPLSGGLIEVSVSPQHKQLPPRPGGGGFILCGPGRG